MLKRDSRHRRSQPFVVPMAEVARPPRFVKVPFSLS